MQNNQSIQTMIMLASTEAGHTAGVVRCDQARAMELANRLELGQQKPAARNTTVAVVTSGLTDVAMGVLTALTSGLVLAITGGGRGVLHLPVCLRGPVQPGYTGISSRPQPPERYFRQA